MSSLPLISDVDAALFRVDALMGAAEAHGALCGMLCARGSTDLSAWSDHVLGEQGASHALSHDTVHVLAAIHQVTMEQMNDAMAEFELLLPDDDDSLLDRVQALASWCQGFVYGLAAGGVSEKTELPEDCSELLRDIIEISRADHEEEEAIDESDEVAYMEIMEYVRTGVLLFNEELQPLQTTNTIQ